MCLLRLYKIISRVNYLLYLCPTTFTRRSELVFFVSVSFLFSYKWNIYLREHERSRAKFDKISQDCFYGSGSLKRNLNVITTFIWFSSNNKIMFSSLRSKSLWRQWSSLVLWMQYQHLIISISWRWKITRESDCMTSVNHPFVLHFLSQRRPSKKQPGRTLTTKGMLMGHP